MSGDIVGLCLFGRKRSATIALRDSASRARTKVSFRLAQATWHAGRKRPPIPEDTERVAGLSRRDSEDTLYEGPEQIKADIAPPPAVHHHAQRQSTWFAHT